MTVKRLLTIPSGLGTCASREGNRPELGLGRPHFCREVDVASAALAAGEGAESGLTYAILEFVSGCSRLGQPQSEDDEGPQMRTCLVSHV